MSSVYPAYSTAVDATDESTHGQAHKPTYQSAISAAIDHTERTAFTAAHRSAIESTVLPPHQAAAV